MMRLWEFAQQLQYKHFSGKPPREVASRMLNFLMTRQYTAGIKWANAAERDGFFKDFAVDESTLYRLSVSSHRVDALAMRFRVDEELLERYLLKGGSNWEPNQTYNPDRNTRMKWIESIPLAE